MKTQNDDWITIKPNGEENKGRHLLIKEVETPKEAIKRTYGVDLDKKKAPSAKDEWKRKAEEQNKTSAYKQTAVQYATGDIMPHTSKSGLKKAGLKSKQIEELAAEGDDITKKIREIIGSEKSDDEKLDALAGLKERSDALKKKVEEYSAQGAASKQEKAAKEEAAKKSVKGFEITQETPKAYLITKDGRQAWIQKKWLKDDGTLTPAAESAVAKGQKTADIARENAEREKGLELPAKPDWESAKAVAYDVDVGIDHSHYSERDEETVGGIEHVKHRIFIPKSMIKDGRVPAWLMEKKIEEAEQQYFSERGGHTMSRGHISDIFGKKVYTEGGRSKIAFTKEKADYLAHRYDDLVENHAIRIGNCLICKVKNKFVTIYNDFEEAKHPRDKNGQFAKKGCQSGGVGHSIKTNKDFENIIERTQKSNKISFTPQQILQNFLNENPQVDASKVQKAIKNAEDYKNAKSFINKNGQKQYSDTQGIYTFKDKTGKRIYTTERLKLHKDILEKLFANKANAKPKDGKAPVFTILGGRGGSGKSKLKGLAYDDKTSVILDADAIKEMLPEYKGFNAWEVHEESSDIVKEALKKARSLGVNVVLDGTLSGYGSAEKKIKDFEDAGYNIDGYYMHLPREESAKRGISRFMQAKDGKGRYVPLDVMLDMKDNEDNFQKLLPHFRKWAMWDNNVKMGQKPVLVQKSWN